MKILENKDIRNRSFKISNEMRRYTESTAILTTSDPVYKEVSDLKLSILEWGLKIEIYLYTIEYNENFKKK